MKRLIPLKKKRKTKKNMNKWKKTVINIEYYMKD